MSKVFVGLSGGVDSAVTAALLKKEGYEVTGIFMKNWSRDIAGNHCPWKDDLNSARSVAAHLDIELKIYDFEKDYFELVTKYMVETYEKGLTPNPDIICNQEIKFRVFFDKCIRDGADYIATGHYAKIKKGKLYIAEDTNKDQTYFLYRMNQDVATKVLMPLGEYKKPEVRNLATKFNLPNHSRADSQGLCFVGNVTMKDFLSEFIEPKKGDIVSDIGEVIGAHMGAFGFTIGQRHGLGIGGGKPYYVYKIDAVKNKVYVTDKPESELLEKKEFRIADCVWWVDKYKVPTKLSVKVRYRSKSIPCDLLDLGKGFYNVKLKKLERAITPGQSAVFYKNDRVIGGGIIQQ